MALGFCRRYSLVASPNKKDPPLARKPAAVPFPNASQPSIISRIEWHAYSPARPSARPSARRFTHRSTCGPSLPAIPSDRLQYTCQLTGSLRGRSALIQNRALVDWDSRLLFFLGLLLKFVVTFRLEFLCFSLFRGLLENAGGRHNRGNYRILALALFEPSGTILLAPAFFA